VRVGGLPPTDWDLIISGLTRKVRIRKKPNPEGRNQSWLSVQRISGAFIEPTKSRARVWGHSRTRRVSAFGRVAAWRC